MTEEKKEATPEVAEEKKQPQKQKKKVMSVGEPAKPKWSVSRCAKAAKRFETEEQWKSGAPSSYKAACSRGWLEECLDHLGGGGQVSLPKSA